MDSEDIRKRLTGPARARIDALEVFAEIESTNTYLLEQGSPLPGRYRVAIAAHQTAGRGRVGKSWLSPESSGLCLSLSYTFCKMPHNLSSLTLASGLAIAAQLQKFGVDDVALKWPNDIIAHGGKLGGILTEMKPGGGGTVVTGIGVNVALPAAMLQSESWIGKISDLERCLASPPTRDELAVAVIGCLFDAISRFERDGFGPFREAWPGFDWLKGKQVVVEQAVGRIEGLANGIDPDGALLVQTKGGRARVVSGSVAVIDDRTVCA